MASSCMTTLLYTRTAVNCALVCFAHLQRGGQRSRNGGGQRLQAVHIAHHPQDARKLEGPPHHLLGSRPRSGCGASPTYHGCAMLLDETGSMSALDSVSSQLHAQARRQWRALPCLGQHHSHGFKRALTMKSGGTSRVSPLCVMTVAREPSTMSASARFHGCRAHSLWQQTSRPEQASL
jgi:hypothetical protein